MQVMKNLVAGRVLSSLAKPSAQPRSAVGEKQKNNTSFMPSDRFSKAKVEATSVSVQQGGLGKPNCRCGNCQACAAKVYDTQAKMLSSGPTTTEPPSQTTLPVEAADEAPPSHLAEGQKGANGEPLSQEELVLLAELKKRDRVVRAHEQAHMVAAAGLVAKGMSFSYQQGPDGRRYAVGGEVQIDAGKEADPAETIAKMKKVRAAALAPADPSNQDRNVAASAMTKMSQARVELRVEQTEEAKNQREAASSINDSSEGAEEDKTPPQHSNFSVYSISRNIYLNPSQFHVQA
jgi:hypothetical protein